MNKHIQLVTKWLADPDSVTAEELKANADAADEAYDVAYYAERAARAAARDAYYLARAASAAAVYDDARADYYVKKYEELTEGE